jgi:RimJ/RimL family protein N-acetyltransferase
MVTTDIISKNKHYNFIKNLKEDNKNRYFLIILDKPIGVVYLNNIESKKAEIGIYLDPKKSGKGFGQKSLEEFIKTLSFSKIYLKVKDKNNLAINLYKKIGFKQYDKKENFYFFSLKLL